MNWFSLSVLDRLILIAAIAITAKHADVSLLWIAIALSYSWG